MKWTRGTIKRKKIWSDGLFTLEIHAPDVEKFEPGQFLQLGIEQEGKHLHRPYSVASPHGEVLDFFIVLVEEGRLTPHLWKMDVGDEIDISQKGVGSFTLSHCPDASTLWLIATGTGLAPYIAMLREKEVWDRYQKIFVLHGVRYAHELAYQDELEAYRSENGDRFDYVPLVSRADVDHGLRGRITHCVENGSLESHVNAEITTDSCIMMCGNPDMLTEMEELLGKRGIKKHKRKEPGQIVFERYW